MSVELEVRGAARIVRVNRPAQKNALDRITLRELLRAARSISRDRSARGIVLCGAGETFTAGGDLREFAKVRTLVGAKRIANIGAEVVEAFWSTGVPLVAAVNGDAFGGGCELATACDYRIAEDHVRFHWVHGKFAVTTAWGGTARLVGLLGPAVTAHWLLGARTVTAVEALDARFVNQLVARGTSVDTACQWIERVATVPKPTVRLELELIRGATGRSPDEARMAELRAFARAWVSKDHQDAVDRFLTRSRAKPTIS